MKLVSIPQVDTSFFDLYLPYPDALNSGGYLVPTPSGSVYTYSQIDLLIAGIESRYLGIKVNSLIDFFKDHLNRIADHKVYITVENNDLIDTFSIAFIKVLCSSDKDLLKMMLKNAPFTFGEI